MRILLVLEDLNDTGANRVSLDRASHWQRAGQDVTVFVAAAVGDGSASGSVPVPAGLTVVRGSRGRRLATALPISLLRLVRLARRAEVVVAGTEVGFALLLSWFATRIARRPFAVTVQSQIDRAVENYVEPRYRGLTRSALRAADLAVCVAYGLVDTTATSTSGRVVAAPNAVPQHDIGRAAILEPSVDWDHTVPLIVGVGRLVHQKGFDLLVRAHARAVRDGAPAHQLMIVGGGDAEPLLALAAELGVASSVILPGFAANPHAIVARASAFALSSRWEGFSLCLAEALACETACIAFDCVAGPAEVLDHGRYGALLPAEDVEAMATAFRDHLDDPDRLATQARLATRDRPAIFDPDHAATRHLDALATLR